MKTQYDANIEASHPITFAACVLFGMVVTTAVHADPVLRCQILQGDTVIQHEVVPASDPYQFKPVDIRKRFRLNAVVVGDASHIDYVKVYAYYYQHGRPVIAHMTHYPSPQVQTAENPVPLTGLQRVYAPPYGFEMQYHCTLVDRTVVVAP